jgi:cell wall-associated NlpC family hydrolase
LPRRTRLLLSLLVLACVAWSAPVAGANVDHNDRLHPRHAISRQARVVRFARRFLGVRYVYGGTSPANGFDCSGFTRYVFAHFGVALPHYTFGQYDLGHSVARSRLEPGDLVFFDGVGHVGLYIGRGRFIHAPHTGTRVSVDRLSGWYGGTYDGARRVL